jgi:hypothetical protein
MKHQTIKTAFTFMLMLLVSSLSVAQALDGSGADDALNLQHIYMSPFVGTMQTYATENLISTDPSMHEDMTLIENQASVRRHQARKNNLQPMVFLSGGLTAKGVFKHYDQSAASNVDINLTRAEIDVLADVNDWFLGLVSMNYDSDGFVNSALLTSRERNSRFYLRRGMVVLGNFDRTPWYASFGQYYMPFGSFSSGLISGSSTGTLGRVNIRGMTVGHHSDDTDYQVFFGRGATYVNNAKTINEWGVSGAHTWTLGAADSGNTFTIGAGYLDNMADANGVVNVMEDQSGRSNLNIQSRVPAADVYVKGAYGALSFSAEYLHALKAFNSTDFAYDGAGAQPGALHAELGFDLTDAWPKSFWPKDSSIALGVEHTQEAINFNLPKNSAFITLWTSWWINTSQGIELRHNEPYPGSPGISRNQLLFLCSVYF